MDQLFTINHAYLIPLLPLIGAAIAGFFGAKWLKGQSHWPIWLGVGCSAVLSIMLLVGMLGMQHPEGADAYHIANQYSLVTNLFTWIQAGSFHINYGYFFDPLTAIMLCVVCGIGFFITVFAAGYMKGEEGYFRFFAYLGLFIFMMTNLVMGENLIMLYLGWEGVGLCSYLLIGYYYDKPAAREAAKKAFLVNRVGDFGFALGIMLCFAAFGTVSYFGNGATTGTGLLELATMPLSNLQTIHGVNAAIVPMALKWIPFLLMIGAFGKSAQFPLYVWLPDAMEGPTPVSALIHAATMVTAGIYMIARCGTLFVGNGNAMWTIAAVGAFTALFAATIALRQFDLKKVFAYSTVSQLGFMFVGVGVFAPVAGVFHLITHAFFKALLFLSSGVVMHAMSGVLDMRQMSGLKKQLPLTRILMLIGCLALAGCPLLAGFFSKDEIVAYAWDANKFLGIVMLFTAGLTAYYTFRLYFRVFEGPLIIPAPPADAHHAHGPDSHGAQQDQDIDSHLAHDPHAHDAHHNHEPAIMMIPLIVLAIGALFAGYLNYPKEHLAEFVGKSPSFIYAYNVAAAAHNPQGELADSNEIVNPIAFGHEDERSKDVIEHDHQTHTYFMVISTLVFLAGAGLAYRNHLANRAAGDKLAASMPGVTTVLEHKYWIDEIYQAAIVEPLRKLGILFFFIDRLIVDGLVTVASFVPQLAGFTLKLTTQRGYLQGYAVSMLFGIAVILIVVFW